jgi:hypothetical protein
VVIEKLPCGFIKPHLAELIYIKYGVSSNYLIFRASSTFGFVKGSKGQSSDHCTQVLAYPFRRANILKKIEFVLSSPPLFWGVFKREF